ncbi:Os07g0273150, partial [Oryza sativa Japonica Group]
NKEDKLYPYKIKKSGLREFARKIPTGHLLVQTGFQSTKTHPCPFSKYKRVLHEMRYYEETIMILNLMPDLVPELVYSATANTTHYRDFDKANLFIKPK